MQAIAEDLKQLVQHLRVVLERHDVVVINVDQVGEDLEDLKINIGGRIPKERDRLLNHLDAICVVVFGELDLNHLDSALCL